MMRRILQRLAALFRRPIAHAVTYVEPDGTHEVDAWDTRDMADHWADWCREDGCTEVEIRPLYTLRELRLASLHEA